MHSVTAQTLRLIPSHKGDHATAATFVPQPLLREDQYHMEQAEKSAQPKPTVPAGPGCTAGSPAGRLPGDAQGTSAAEAVPGEHTLSSLSLCSFHGLPRSWIKK